MKKWIFYRTICILDVSLVAILLLFTIYESGGRFTGAYGLADLVMISICAICFITDILNIRLIKNFSTHQNFNKNNKIILIIFYVLLCVLLFSLGCFIVSALYHLYKPDQDGPDDVMTIYTDIFFSCLFLTSFIKVIYTWIVFNALKKSNHLFFDSFNNIGVTD